MAINQLSCSNYSAYNDAEGIDYSTSISYWDSNLLGFSNFSSYFVVGHILTLALPGISSICIAEKNMSWMIL